MDGAWASCSGAACPPLSYAAASTSSWQVQRSKKEGYTSDGVADLIIGDEAKVSRYNTALHVLMNALSTLLLAGCHYAMQVLSSSSRHDVDQVHAKGRWLDIGVLSPRNLRTIP
jgi:hypothetical protein